MRSRGLAAVLITFSFGFAFAGDSPSAVPHAAPALHGVVADPTGAIVPGAEVELVDPTGAITSSFQSDGEGNFQLTAPHAGSYTVVVSEAGFETVRTPVEIALPSVLGAGAPAAAALAKPLHII